MKKKKSVSPYFDDCPICQAMKKAEEEGRNLSLEEVKKAFMEAKKKGGIVSFPKDTEDETLN